MSGIPHIRFAINETPHCFWDRDIRRRNLDFINSLDPGYFEHIADVHGEQLEGDEKLYAATALRVAYSHGLESLFALRCAVAQAPDCVIGWLLRYQNQELYKVVRKISERRLVYTRLRAERVSWDDMADLVFAYLKTGDDEKDARIRNSFGRLWRRFASEFVDENHGFEYNSIKHGSRARMGGFYFAMGAEDVPGVPAPPERMRVIGQSDFGSSFFVPEKLHDRRNFSVKHQSLNWNPQNFVYGLKLISLSITNIAGFLKIFYGAPAQEVNFSWLSDEVTFQEPWSRTTGISSFAWNSNIEASDITPLSREDILAVYTEGEADDGEAIDSGGNGAQGSS